MRSMIAVGMTVLVCTIQGCQRERETPIIAAAPSPESIVVASQSERTMRLRKQARAYAERLDQGRCAPGRERAEFDDALSAVESNLPALRNAETASPVIHDAQLASDAEQVLAEVRLDVADAARTGGCSDIANSQYQVIVRTFRGPAFARYRQRAEMGLSAMQL
jgi:hypothetical protein